MDIYIISLDFVGVIVSKDFIDYFWLDLVPYAYSLKHKTPFEKAREIVYEEYSKVGEDKVEWYLIDFWAKRFNIEEYIPTLLNMASTKIHVYDDVFEVLPILASRVRSIIILTNTTTPFIDLFFSKYPELRKLIKKIYSCVSHYGIPRKTREFYEIVIKELNVEPSKIVHVGDDPLYDYDIPRSLGINAIIIARGEAKVKNKRDAITSLRELLKVV